MRGGWKGALLFSAFGLAMVSLNLLDVMTLSDDLLYRFVWQADEQATPQRLLTLADLWQSQLTHYEVQNGRAVVHTLGQAMLTMIPQWVFQVVNGLLALLLLWLCVRFAERKASEHLLTAVTALLLLFVVMRGVRTTMLWSIGTVNYLWVTVATLAFVRFLQWLGGRPVNLLHVLLSPLALLVGWSHEALALAVTVAFAAFLLMERRRLSTPLPAILLYMSWYAVGCCLCLLSPGIWGRAADGITLNSRVLTGCLNMVFNVRVVWLLLLCFLWTWFHNRQRLFVVVRCEQYLLVALLVSMTIVFLCGTSLERVAFFADFMAMLIILRNFLPTGRWATLLRNGGVAVLLLCYAGALWARLENAANFRFMESQMKEPQRELIAVRHPVKGENWLKDVLRDCYVNPTAEFGFFCSYMGFNADDINMRCAAIMYQKERMVFLPTDVVERIESTVGSGDAYEHCRKDACGQLFVWRMKHEGDVRQVVFELNDEDPSTLLPHQRLVAWPGDTYELDDDHYQVVKAGGRSYLVFTRPTTNIYRRIKRVKVIIRG